MKLFRRKLWGDRFVWLIALAATVIVVNQYTSRGGQTRLYILVGWLLVLAMLFGYGELKIGRKQLRRGRDAMFLGLAAYVGEETLAEDGTRRRGWHGTAAGALTFEPQGIRWVPKSTEGGGPAELSFSWPDVYSFRLTGVVPLVWRASGYFLLSIYGGREYVFHINGIRAWRRAVREAMIAGPTLLPREAGALESAPAVAAAEAPAATPDVAFEAVIGLECHVELSTASKMFCGCPTTFGAEPNTQICPVCSGQPGTLPVPNRGAVEYAMRIALALHCAITPESIFHRKNYFYPDMPKNYQISQYDIPLATSGFLDVELDNETKRIGIERVHLEEDTGKTIHSGVGGRIGEADYAKIDYNRAGIPLVEIVSEPDMRTPEEARAYVAELRGLLGALGVSDVRMEEGSLRVDANVSVRVQGAEELGVKVEVKNMNSLRSVQRALAFEIERQTELAKANQPITQETRHFDEGTGQTIGGRSKEFSSDYRYFPDPDLLPLQPSLGWVESVRGSMPELPAQKRERLQTAYALPTADARILVASPGLAEAFETAAKAYGGDGPSIARWYLGELAQLGNERNVEPHEAGVSPEHVAELQKLVDAGTISISLAKGEVLRKIAETGANPQSVVVQGGLVQISDESELDSIVERVIAENPAVVDQVRGGKTGAINALVGQVMKETRGQANAQVAHRLLTEKLGTQEPPDEQGSSGAAGGLGGAAPPVQGS